MADKTSTKSKKVARKAAASRVAAKPALLAGGNPQIAKGYGDAPVQAYIAAMPGWKRDVGRRLDALIARTVPGVAKAVKWNSPFYGVEGQERKRLVPQLSLLHEVREGGLLPRRVAASRPARRVQAKASALPRHPRGRPARRSPARRLGEASEPLAGGAHVSLVGWVSAKRVTQHGSCRKCWVTAFGLTQPTHWCAVPGCTRRRDPT